MNWAKEITTMEGGAKEEYSGVDHETRESNRVAIRAAVSKWSPGGDPRVLETIAYRESRWNHLADGDKSIAPRVFAKLQDKWIRRGNIWANQPELWGASRGLFQAMIPYALMRWDPLAHPYSFYSPIVATAHAARLWNDAVRRGAENMIDVRMVWAFGPKGLNIPRDDDRYTSRVRSTVSRLKKLGYPPTLATRSAAAAKLHGFGTTKQPGQEHKVAEIAKIVGLPPVLPPLGHVPSDWTVKPGTHPDDPKDTQEDESQWGVALGVGAAILGGVLLLAAATKGRK